MMAHTMPSDSHSFDELKLSFIFVPHGSPEPTEWLERHPDWIKLPATFVPRGDGNRPTGSVAGVHPRAQVGSADGPAASSIPHTPVVPQADDAMLDQTLATPGSAAQSDDPITAYRTANDALETATAGYASVRDTGPTAPSSSTEAGDATSADRAEPLRQDRE
jgi:hypothetical protein